MSYEVTCSSRRESLAPRTRYAAPGKAARRALFLFTPGLSKQQEHGAVLPQSPIIIDPLVGRGAASCPGQRLQVDSTCRADPDGWGVESRNASSKARSCRRGSLPASKQRATPHPALRAPSPAELGKNRKVRPVPLFSGLRSKRGHSRKGTCPNPSKTPLLTQLTFATSRLIAQGPLGVLNSQDVLPRVGYSGFGLTGEQ